MPLMAHNSLSYFLCFSLSPDRLYLRIFFSILLLSLIMWSFNFYSKGCFKGKRFYIPFPNVHSVILLSLMLGVSRSASSSSFYVTSYSSISNIRHLKLFVVGFRLGCGSSIVCLLTVLAGSKNLLLRSFISS